MPKGELKGVLDADRASPVNGATLVRVPFAARKGRIVAVLQRSRVAGMTDVCAGMTVVFSEAYRLKRFTGEETVEGREDACLTARDISVCGAVHQSNDFRRTFRKQPKHFGQL